MMAHKKGWTDEREALESVEVTSDAAVRARRQLPTRDREHFLRAVAREILRDGGASRRVISGPRGPRRQGTPRPRPGC